MEQKPTDEEEWQGFERFQESSVQQAVSLPPIPTTAIIASSINVPPQSKQTTPTRLPVARPPKSKHKKKLPDVSTIEVAKRHTAASVRDVQKCVEEAAKQIKKVKRYKRIPITRADEEQYRNGKRVYHAFHSRNSDTWLRGLREVDWNRGEKTPLRKAECPLLSSGKGSLAFDSKFEGGNLSTAIQVTGTQSRVGHMQYDLYMRVDTNTAGHKQWFYFSASNQRKGRVTFHIYRFKKMYSLYQRGMRPYVRSRKQGGEWKPGGDSVYYRYETPLRESQGKPKSRTFVLSFSYTFKHDNDEVFFAAGIPYTYSFLQRRLQVHSEAIDERGKLSIVMSKLGQSMCGVDLPLLTVEHRLANMLNDGQKKRFVVINARTHSGQTSCSWVLDGLLAELGASEQVEAWMLRENVAFKIVPMLNPDGVMLGNYRTGIMGEDFNRKFNTGKKEFLPEIYHLKKLVSQCKKQGKVMVFIDLHGHSVLKNSFIYGPSPQYSDKFQLGGLPQHLADQSKYFRLNSCKLKNAMNLVETARMNFQVTEKILAFTCENSLGLYHHQGQTSQMLTGDYQSFGKSILHAMRMTCSDWQSRQPSLSSQSPKIKIKLLDSPHRQERKQSPIKINLLGADSQQGHQSLVTSQMATPNVPMREKKLSLTDQGVKLKKIGNERTTFKIKRRSQIMRKTITPVDTSEHGQADLEEKDIEKDKQQRPSIQRSVTDLSQNPNTASKSEDMGQERQPIQRSATDDNYSILVEGIEKMRERENTEEGISSTQAKCKYQLVSIDEQDFSDGYVSINDLDSLSEDLPQHQRANLQEYIIANNLQEPDQETDLKRELKELKQIRERDRRQRGMPASKNSSHEVKMTNIDDWGTIDYVGSERKTIMKRKMDTHKFKDKAFRSLTHKPKKYDEESLVAISYQKQLVQREGERSKRRHSLQKVELKIT